MPAARRTRTAMSPRTATRIMTTRTITSTATTVMAITATTMTTIMAITAIPMLTTTSTERGASDAPAADIAALFRLMTWLSPAFPVGAFSYSSGIEWAVEAGDIADLATLRDWLAALLRDGAGFCDGVLLCHAHRAAAERDASALSAVAELAAAFVSSRERHLETTAQGRAFVEIARAAWPCAALDLLPAQGGIPIAYPVAVGVLAAGHGVGLRPVLHGYLHALAANWISAGTRLIPLGQTDSQRALAALEPVIAATADACLVATLDDLGSATFRADLAGMQHETQYTRLFRS